MPKRKRPELTPKEQSKRFKALAKEVGVSQDEEEHARVFQRIARAPVKKEKPKGDVS